MPTFWKYNIDSHIFNEHNAGYDGPVERLGSVGPSDAPQPDLRIRGSAQRRKHISMAEMETLGVPKAAVSTWREAVNVPNTSDLEPDSEVESLGQKGKAASRGAKGAGQKRQGTSSVGGGSMPVAKKAK